MDQVLRQIEGGLIVSCQATPGTPLDGPNYMAAMAESAQLGGAVGIRANGGAHIRAIKQRVSLPVIGILKRRDLAPHVWITPDLKSAEVVARAGAEIVAMDATKRPRPSGVGAFSEIAAELKSTHSVLVMADVSTVEEGLSAAEAGADIVATTLSGYTPYSVQMVGPDFDLVSALALKLDIPVIAEGRYTTPTQVCQALEAGAFAVVVGQAITNPLTTTKRFIAALGAKT